MGSRQEAEGRTGKIPVGGCLNLDCGKRGDLPMLCEDQDQENSASAPEIIRFEGPDQCLNQPPSPGLPSPLEIGSPELNHNKHGYDMVR
jgi:hypothetical protein